MAKRIKTGNSFDDIEGLDEVRDLLQDLEAMAPDIYERELDYAGEKIMHSARSKVNSISGDLSESIQALRKHTKKRKLVEVIAGGTIAPHAHLVEFGHRQVTKNGEVVGDVPAHPFLRSAFEEYKGELIQKLENAINNLIK